MPGDSISALARVFLERGVIDEEQLRYAERVRTKLRPPRPVLQVLKDLGHVTDERVHQVLSQGPTDVPVEELLLELDQLGQDEFEQAQRILTEAGDPKKTLGQVLVEHQFVDEPTYYRCVAYQRGVAFEQPDLDTLDRSLLDTAPGAWCKQHHFIPLRNEGDKVVIAFAAPVEEDDVHAAQTVFGEDKVTPVLAPPGSIDRSWEALAHRARASTEEEHEETEEIVALVNGMIEAAMDADVSDIHIEPGIDRLRVRFRQDGVLVPYRELSLQQAPPISSRLKVMARADIAERRRHQDGRISYTRGTQELDMRASFYVTVHGEKTVLRLLNRDRPLLSLPDTGMPSVILEKFREGALDRPSGVILVTGPTGSGKTSTLYSCIHAINDESTAIITAEDPVEYVIDGIAQCSLNPDIELDYEETLRHIVRQDPDVIVIGEIRDQFSAETAIQAALTGHKVLTTFHTEDTIGGLLRLLNMNIEAFLISSTVVSVLAQRLLRRVCSECAVPYEPTAADLRNLGYTGDALAEADMQIGRGCGHCRHTGYRGRVCIFELLVLEEEIRDAIVKRKTSHEIRRISREANQLVSLFEDGIVKAASGQTTVNEIVRMLPRLDRPRPLAELRRLVGD